MDTKELFIRVIDYAGTVIAQLRPDTYRLPTPDTEWNAKTLGAHMLYELSWIPDMLSGKTIEEVGDTFEGDLLGDNLAEAWNLAADKASEAVKKCDMDATAHLSYADVSNREYIRQVSGDLFIHTWDLSVALGANRSIDPAVAQVIYDGTKPRIDDLQSSGLFHTPLEVTASADIQTKLLALFGRDANWQPDAR